MTRIRPALAVLPASHRYSTGSKGQAHGTWLSSAGFRCHYFGEDGIRRVYDWAACVCICLPRDPFSKVLARALGRRGLVFLHDAHKSAREAAMRAHHAVRIPSEKELIE